MPPDLEQQPSAVACPACGERYAGAVAFCPKDGARLLPAPEGAATLPERSSSLIGKVLADRYRILRKLGEGGMGEVFEAQHIYIDKRYAIKTLRPEVTTSPEAVARFHQEARSASVIGHENIVEIDDFGRLADGSVYLAMEFLEGLSLADRMKQPPPLPVEECLEYMIQVGRGLAAAHEKGIIHRDLKPENIFLARKHGRVVPKVLDFGIAKVTRDSSMERLTQTGAIFGTPFYMSPEQALGRPLDPRTDVYSVGVILYELFAGRVPFQGESFMGILSQHITTPPLPPSQAAPSRYILPEVERIILRAMAKEPGERYATMHALVDDLEQLVEPVPAPPVGTALRRSVESGPSLLRPTVEGQPATASLGSFTGGGAPPMEIRRTIASPYDPQVGPYSSTAGRRRAEVLLEPDGSEPEPIRTERDPEPGVAVEDAAIPLDELRPRRSRAPLVALGAVALLAAGGAAALVLVRGRAPERAPDEPRPAPTVVPVAPSPPTKTAPAPAAEPVDTVEVVLDSQPPGARVFANGRVIAETPDAIRVPRGGTLEVLLRKEGFNPKQIVLDPAHEPRMVVRLEREHHSGAPAHAAPAHAAPAHAPPHPAHPVAAPTGTPLSPYPDSPPPNPYRRDKRPPPGRRPAVSPSQGGAPLIDPYN
jgi:serine/threonine-protein kinase